MILLTATGESVPHTRGDEPQRSVEMISYQPSVFPTPVGMNRQQW